jgi:hypothetical protein
VNLLVAIQIWEIVEASCAKKNTKNQEPGINMYFSKVHIKQGFYAVLKRIRDLFSEVIAIISKPLYLYVVPCQYYNLISPVLIGYINYMKGKPHVPKFLASRHLHFSLHSNGSQTSLQLLM